MATPVALILGAGANIGQNVARAFAAKGYKIALVARSLKEEDSTPSQLNIKADFSDAESIAGIFAKVKAKLGAPYVVVYNAATATFPSSQGPLAISIKDFNRDLNVNLTSAFAAAQEAAQAFEELPDTASRTFIYTGNITNVAPIPRLLTNGVGKAGTAHVIQVAAEVYKEKGFKFYYADERKADGSAAYGDIDGPAAGQFYTELAETKTQGPWQQTFVKGAGYKKF